MTKASCRETLQKTRHVQNTTRTDILTKINLYIGLVFCFLRARNETVLLNANSHGGDTQPPIRYAIAVILKQARNDRCIQKNVDMQQRAK